jgi:hypothetical protein
MMAVFPCSAGLVPVCRQAGFRLSAYWIGRAERDERAEGKIEETGTLTDRFPKLLLSAHWLGSRFRHHGLAARSAAIWRNALALQGSDRHHGRRLPDISRFWPEARP